MSKYQRCFANNVPQISVKCFMTMKVFFYKEHQNQAVYNFEKKNVSEKTCFDLRLF